MAATCVRRCSKSWEYKWSVVDPFFQTTKSSVVPEVALHDQ